MENWYDAFGDNWAERLGSISSIVSPQMSGWARLGGRLIDDGNNPKPKRLPMAESYTSVPEAGFPELEKLPTGRSYTSVPEAGFSQAPDPSAYSETYAQKLENSRKFDPMRGVSMMPPQRPQPDYQTGATPGPMDNSVQNTTNQLDKLQQMGQQQQAQGQQQSGAMAGLATQALSAAGYSI